MKHKDIYEWDPKLAADPTFQQRKKYFNKTSDSLVCDGPDHYAGIKEKFPPHLQKEYELPIEYKHNNIGFRNHRDISDHMNEGILAIGDSFTEGDGVRYEDLWTSQLEKELNVPVHNFGICNTGLDEWFRIFLRYSRKFSDKRVYILSTFFSRFSTPNKHHYWNPIWVDDFVDIWRHYFVCDNHTHYTYQIKMLAIQQLADKFGKELIVYNLHELLDNPLMHDDTWWHSGKDHTGKYDLARDGLHLGKNFHDDITQKFLELTDIY